MKLLFAYLDAGTGSLIVQAVVGAVVGVGVFFKNIRMKVVGIFKKDKKTSPSATPKAANKNKTDE